MPSIATLPAVAAVIAMSGMAAAVPLSSHASTGSPAWKELSAALDAWQELSFDAVFGVNLGDASGSIFTYESKNFSMADTSLLGASLSKWPSAVMISGLVADGIMSYDDKPSKYLPWWDTDPSNPRSNVTLRSLLSFTSGLLDDPIGIYACPDPLFLTCAERAYKEAQKPTWNHKPKWTAPNTTFQYLSGHLQFAGAMAAAAAKQPIQDLFSKYLYIKYNMTKTSYTGDGSSLENPLMAAGIVTTGADFENMLHSLLAYEGLPPHVQTEMERDYTQPPVDPSGDGWFGHYAMGHWWECLGYGTPSERVAPLPPICTDAKIQAGPGEYGYYPIIDRSGGGGAAGPKRSPYYFQVPLQEPDALSGIPEYLRLVTKPVADLILAGQDPASVPRTEIVKNGGGLLARDVAFIQGELGDCTCSKETQKGEPYASLMANLPKDDPSKNRDVLLAQGIGLTIFDVARIQSTLGSCVCQGRQQADHTVDIQRAILRGHRTPRR